MKIKQFCEKYNGYATEQLKADFIKDNLKINEYIPFVAKDALATRLLDLSMYEYEDYLDENGEIKRRKTGNIRVNSIIQYLLFCRLVIENYTNLEIETDGFYEEYDALRQCGLLDKLIGEQGIIPFDDISELKNIIQMKQGDIMTNYATPQSFIANQIERITTIGSVALKPLLEKITITLENMDESKIEKLGKTFEKVFKRVR